MLGQLPEEEYMVVRPIPGFLPEELDGLLTFEDWKLFLHGQFIHVGGLRIRCLDARYGYMDIVWPDGTTVQTIADCPSGMNVTYAALQLAIRAPNYLLDELYKIWGRGAKSGYLRLVV